MLSIHFRKKSLVHSLGVVLLAGFFLTFMGLQIPQEAKASATNFTFVAWADTKSGISTLRNESIAIKAMNPSPVFTIFPGDLCSSGPNASCFATWKNAANGGTNNGIFDKTFATRGNHDSGGGTYWRDTAFEFSAVANAVGATPGTYTEFSKDMTYSFDYGNSHFVGIDVPGGAVGDISAGAISWLNTDLVNAKNRGITHAFLFWHGPIYPVAEHCCSDKPSTALAAVLRDNPIIAATFHGHEHVVAYKHITSSIISGLTEPFEEFVSGAAGAGAGGYTMESGRADAWLSTSGWTSGSNRSSKEGFVSVAVNCNKFTVTIHNVNGSVAATLPTFTNGTGCTTPTGTPTPSGTPTPTPSGTLTPTPSVTPTPIPCVPPCVPPETCSSGICVAPPPACDNFSGGLVPCGRLCDDPKTIWNETDTCNFCHLFIMSQLIIEFLIRLAGMAAMISIAIGGLLYIFAAGSSETINKAKSMIKYTLTGFIVIFIAWTVINSVLYLSGYIDPMGGKWYAMDCTLGSGPTPTPTPSVSPTPAPSGTPTPTPSVSPTPSPTPTPGPKPGPLPASCTHLVYNEGGQVRGKQISTGAVVVSGTLKQVLSGTGSGIGKTNNHICIQNGNYSLTWISDMQDHVTMECESNAIINAPNNDVYLIQIDSGSIIKNCTFNHTGNTKTIFASGNVRDWRVENNYFINSDIAVIAENTATGVEKNVDKPNNFPTSGYGFILNNKGLHSKLTTMEGQRNITVTGNYFTDLDGSEYADFNYNVHHVLFDSNTFINSSGYSLSQEVIDMIGGNGYLTSYNTISNNRIIANFQTAIRPAKSSSYNVITGNYIEFKPGKIAEIAAMYLYSGGNSFGTPKQNQITNNTIVGGKVGIELSGANNNTVTGNNISGVSTSMTRGIALLKDSSSGYGVSQSPMNNTVSVNTINNIDYGVYSASSPTNTVTGNIITNFRIKAIFP